MGTFMYSSGERTCSVSDLAESLPSITSGKKKTGLNSRSYLILKNLSIKIEQISELVNTYASFTKQSKSDDGVTSRIRVYK